MKFQHATNVENQQQKFTRSVNLFEVIMFRKCHMYLVCLNVVSIGRSCTQSELNKAKFSHVTQLMFDLCERNQLMCAFYKNFY